VDRARVGHARGGDEGRDDDGDRQAHGGGA
jgi:hypothetical protein